MKANNDIFLKYIKDNTMRLKITRRGGGIEIDLKDLLKTDLDLRISAYQNYLGGGLLGAVQSDINFIKDGISKNKLKLLNRFQEFLKEYFFNLTNEEAEYYDEWNSQSYEQNQNMSSSAY